ncbi:MAG: YceI family protein [Flavobacteriales bacterium]|nr:YceI family protein [Flavobacteriales bacterium]
MKIQIKIIPYLLSLSFLLSCNTAQEQNIKVEEKKNETVKPDTCIYSFSDSTIKLFWAGYKTTDKLKVLGSFQEITTNHADQKFSSIEDLVNGITFSVNSKSSGSGDPIRDANLRDYFFYYLTDNFQINGHISEYNDDFVTANIDVLGIDRQVKFSHSVANNVLKMRALISLDELGAIKAYSSISDKCYELHKGPDGISKTWDEVNVLIDVQLIKEGCN